MTKLLSPSWIAQDTVNPMGKGNFILGWRE
jgi:hypothetical protein